MNAGTGASVRTGIAVIAFYLLRYRKGVAAKNKTLEAFFNATVAFQGLPNTSVTSAYRVILVL
jgi:hypothetical protein